MVCVVSSALPRFFVRGDLLSSLHPLLCGAAVGPLEPPRSVYAHPGMHRRLPDNPANAEPPPTAASLPSSPNGLTAPKPLSMYLPIRFTLELKLHGG